MLNPQPTLKEETAFLKLKVGPSNIAKELAGEMMKKGWVYFISKSSCKCSGDRYSLTEHGKILAEQTLIKYNLTKYPKRCIQCGNVTMNGQGESGKIYCRRCFK